MLGSACAGVFFEHYSKWLAACLPQKWVRSYRPLTDRLFPNSFSLVCIGRSLLTMKPLTAGMALVFQCNQDSLLSCWWPGVATVRETTGEWLDLEATAASSFWTCGSMMHPGPCWKRRSMLGHATKTKRLSLSFVVVFDTGGDTSHQAIFLQFVPRAHSQA